MHQPNTSFLHLPGQAKSINFSGNSQASVFARQGAQASNQTRPVGAGAGWLDLNLTTLVPDVSFDGVRRRGEDEEVQSPLPLPAKKHRASNCA